LPLCEALQVLHARGNAVEELLAALKDGKVKAFGWITLAHILMGFCGSMARQLCQQHRRDCKKLTFPNMTFKGFGRRNTMKRRQLLGMLPLLSLQSPPLLTSYCVAGHWQNGQTGVSLAGINC
jgi:hypothetical protein